MFLKEKEAREKLLSGINQNVDIVKKTLGAKGKNVMIIDARTGMHSKITKDGVSVSKSIYLDNAIENAGSDLVKKAADMTVREAGDSTTSTSILTQAFCQEIHNEINLGKDTNKLCEDLKADLLTVKKYISGKSTKIKNTTELHQIAMVSSNSDKEVADILKNIYDEIGFEGMVNVRETDSFETSFDIVKGYTLPNTGYINPNFINNHEKSRIELINPRVVIYNGKITQVTTELEDLLSQNVPSKDGVTPLVIIANDMEDHILGLILSSLSAGQLSNVFIVRSNLIYKSREYRFRDACAFLDADYSPTNLERFGTCEKIVIDKDETTFINGKGDIADYLKKLKEENKKQTDQELKDRIFRLESNAAIINVGGKLKDEIIERKDRVDDAVLSVRSSIEEGYCAGGSSTLIFARKDLKLKTDIMRKALLSCYNQLLLNAGKEPSYELRDITDKEYGYGYNVVTGKVENLLEKGIIDSSKALRVSLENAVQTACTFAMIDAIIE